MNSIVGLVAVIVLTATLMASGSPVETIIALNAKAQRESGSLSSEDLGKLTKALRDFSDQYNDSKDTRPTLEAGALFASLVIVRERNAPQDSEAVRTYRGAVMQSAWRLISDNRVPHDEELQIFDGLTLMVKLATDRISNTRSQGVKEAPLPRYANGLDLDANGKDTRPAPTELQLRAARLMDCIGSQRSRFKMLWRMINSRHLFPTLSLQEGYFLSKGFSSGQLDELLRNLPEDLLKPSNRQGK